MWIVTTITRACCHLLLVGLAVSGTQTLAQAKAEAIPPEELAKLPFLHFSGNNLGEADIFRMRQEETTIEANGQRYIGFTFWSTGLVEWLFINTPGNLEPGTWILVNAAGDMVHAAEPRNVPLEDCPRVVARYPETSRVSKYETSGEELGQRGRYHLLQRVANSNPARYGLCFRSLSPDSYEAGRDGTLLPEIRHPLLRETSDVVIENMKEIRGEQGTKAAVEHLTREMEQRIDDLENYQDFPEAQQREARGGFIGLYLTAWYEGQTGGGRLDSDWASEVYGVMHDVCVRRGYYSRTDVALNRTSALMSAGRYGKLAEVFEVWKEGARLGGYNLDTRTYPDLGPAFDILPQVRKRDIPYAAPYKNAKDAKSRPGGLGSNFISTFENYAIHLRSQGRWHEALEWFVWVNAWAADAEGNPRDPWKGQQWHPSLMQIAETFELLGFREQALALHKHALAQEITGGYEGKFIRLHTMSILNLKSKLGMPVPDDTLETIRNIIVQSDGNIYQSKTSVEYIRTDLAEILIHLGRVAEGEALLDELAGRDLRHARIARVKHWVGIGRSEGVESELLQLLEQSRVSGLKLDEIELYRIYADFLEQQGRLGEALWLRRELVRLTRAFDLFTHLPVELAKLAALLNRMGHHEEAGRVADEARALLAKGGIPDHMVRTAEALLGGIKPGTTADAEDKDSAKRVEFQPLTSTIAPLEGGSWVSHVTLTNVTDAAQSGTLKSSGLPVRFRMVNEDDVDLIATLGADAGAAELVVDIEPANYKVIALAAARGFTQTGELELTWTSTSPAADTRSRIVLAAADGTTTKAIIQAGAYQMNPFYGIPIYHHYVDSESAELSPPMRFVGSQRARVEIYGMNGSPLGIDAQGNGSLQDAGDELFITGDGDGHLRLPLTQGGSSFVIRIYPQGELPKEGLTLRIECLHGEAWQPYAEDHLLPAAAE